MEHTQKIVVVAYDENGNAATYIEEIGNAHAHIFYHSKKPFHPDIQEMGDCDFVGRCYCDGRMGRKIGSFDQIKKVLNTELKIMNNL